MSNPRKSKVIIAAIIGLIGAIVAALIVGIFTLLAKRVPEPTPLPPIPPIPNHSARLKGMVMDRAGHGISPVNVSIRGGPEAVTDSGGNFVLNDVAAGDQVIAVKPLSGGGEVTQNVHLDAGQTLQTNVVYDAKSSRLGLLSISSPLDDTPLDVRVAHGVGTATIYGHMDGIDQVLGKFDVWVLVKPERAESYYVQHPPATLDFSNNTWRADISIGDAAHPPADKDRWTLVAFAAPVSSDLKRIASASSLSALPQSVSSNVVTVTSTIKRVGK